jgi:hypothetical protein
VCRIEVQAGGSGELRVNRLKSVKTEQHLVMKQKDRRKKKTYNSRDSLVVTHPATNRPACGLNAVNTWVGALAR